MIKTQFVQHNLLASDINKNVHVLMDIVKHWRSASDRLENREDC